MMGILRLAFKLLVNDKAKFIALTAGITFAVFLMVQMTSLFAGILAKSAATVNNIGAKIWVMDPAVQTVANSIPMPDYVLDAVRSIDGVKYAVPLYSGGALVKLQSGNYQAVTVIGLDDASLFGRPALLKGKIEDIYAENSFFLVKDSEFRKFEDPKLGTEFELNNHRGVISGIATVPVSGLFGIPTLYTTYNRAIAYIPQSQFTLTYILVEPKSTAVIPNIEAQIAKLGYKGLTLKEFVSSISKFYMFQTGLGMNIMIMTIISFIVGLSISAQTFYTFILENSEKFGALKAIGAKGYELVYMILFQAAFTAFIGYGLGIGLCVAMISIAKLRIPDYAATITYTNLEIALVMVIVIAAASGYIGVRRVIKIQPFDIFRS
jgi:putative ABC transport system permease protein